MDPLFAAEIRRRRAGVSRTFRRYWHLDEVFVRVNEVRHHLWRAVDQEGEVLEVVVSKTRDKKEALKFLKKLMKRQGRAEELITDKLRSFSAALKEIGGADRRSTDRWENVRAGDSHQLFRRPERAMLQFWRLHSFQKFASVHSSVCNHFNSDRSLCSRDVYKLNRAAAPTEWRAFCAA